MPGNFTVTGDRCVAHNCVNWKQGIWPTIQQDGSIVNGGVPQSGNLSLHLSEIRKQLPLAVPDASFSGNIVLDFEAWAPVWQENDAKGWWHSDLYQAFSAKVAKERFPHFTVEQLNQVAKSEFQSAALQWMVATLNECRRVRPLARLGFYGLPASPGNEFQKKKRIYGGDSSLNQFKANAEQELPVWYASDALYPSIYLSGKMTEEGNKAFIAASVKESLRLAEQARRPPLPVIPFQMLQYHNHTTLLSPADVQASFEVPCQLGAAGVIVWGGNMENAPFHQRGPFQKYWNEVAGPIASKFIDCNQ